MAKPQNRESTARRGPPVPPLATTAQPPEPQGDAGARVRHVRFELSPKTLVAVVLVVASLWLLIRLWPVLLVLVVALFVAGTLSPVVRWLEAKGAGRRFGIAIVFTIFFLLGFIVVVLTIPTLAAQTVALLENAPALRARFSDYLAGFHLMPAVLWAAENGTGTEVAFGGQAKMVKHLSPAPPASFPPQERPVLKLFCVDAMTPMSYHEGRKMESDPHAH